MDDDQRYRAVRSRDTRFDGRFYTGVTSTGIYCRPSCPAIVPKRSNLRFYRSSAAAQAAGFRACKRCRPDASPGSPEWNLRGDVVARAIRLIADGTIDRGGVSGLASSLGYSERQLRRHLTEELGAGPLALARAQRAQTARILIETTDVPMAEIAFAAGFASVRQFNDTIHAVFAATPSEMRTRAARRPGDPAPGTVSLRLPTRQPFDAGTTLRFLADRAIPGVEEWVHGVYRRVLRLHHGTGIVELAPESDRAVTCRLRLQDLRDLTAAVARCRHLLDLDADPQAVNEVLSTSPIFAPLAARRPGLRAPGQVDPTELAVRAVLGQQISVAAARTHAGRLVARIGDPLPSPSGGLTHVFPSAETIAAAPLETLPMPRTRATALSSLTDAVARGELDLGPGCDRERSEAQLRTMRGIGPWTAAYIRMRGMGDPDVFLAEDLGVRRALGRGTLSTAAARRLGDPCAPFRSYATHHLWNQHR
ncbi:DNA-3-methyladenine glycosylase 2 family protein [Spiractinospora alimapuensis]|uniref:DNA-3-methyladenine glycosylase 2 n=1 Tax=Spiractinospora alimapuensis TaxID=2820884 RepID=UPI001F315C74|nr:DNA-3-methyladenine glycosylase 2 [Spiractinospora alimapuensis]QVQ51115.1 DNA-3-methyladenine glycosylase 2 family protein [Spiractinospora alimapuensis]